MHTVLPKDTATPAALRRYRREEREALQAYIEARCAFLALDRAKCCDTGLYRYFETEAAMERAIDAREEWLSARDRRQRGERIRDEMASGVRDALGRLVEGE